MKRYLGKLERKLNEEKSWKKIVTEISEAIICLNQKTYVEVYMNEMAKGFLYNKLENASKRSKKKNGLRVVSLMVYQGT